jgi:hypothetical protein
MNFPPRDEPTDDRHSAREANATTARSISPVINYFEYNVRTPRDIY